MVVNVSNFGCTVRGVGDPVGIVPSIVPVIHHRGAPGDPPTATKFGMVGGYMVQAESG